MKYDALQDKLKEALAIGEVLQGVHLGITSDVNIAAAPAVAARRGSVGFVLGALVGPATIAALAGLDDDNRFVNKHLEGPIS